MSAPHFTLNEINGKWRWHCDLCGGHSKNFSTAEAAQGDFEARHGNCRTERPQGAHDVREECPHCDAAPPSRQLDMHVARQHADIPPCTARIETEHRETYRCAFRAGHKEGRGEYGAWHASAHGSSFGSRHVWSDNARGATPHQPPEPSDSHDEDGHPEAPSDEELNPALPVRPDPRQAAYDAVYEYIRALGGYLPPDPVHRNAVIWRAVNAALNATPVGRCVSSHCVEGGHILPVGQEAP